jgi:hypothetical protein
MFFLPVLRRVCESGNSMRLFACHGCCGIVVPQAVLLNGLHPQTRFIRQNGLLCATQAAGLQEID